MTTATIAIQSITRNFGKTKAVDRISLDVHPKEIYALIGPNGAGKTTLIKMLVGLLPPSSGRASIAGHNITSDPLGAKKEFGYVPDNPAVYDFLTGYEFLKMTGALSGLPPKDINTKVQELAKIFPIADILKERMGSYSRGNRQKVGFLSSIIVPHKVLIIDEPIVGLDPSSITIFGDCLTRFAASGGSILLATHTLSFAQKYAHRVGVVDRGRLVDEKVVAKVNLEKLYLDKITNDQHR